MLNAWFERPMWLWLLGVAATGALLFLYWAKRQTHRRCRVLNLKVQSPSWIRGIVLAIGLTLIAIAAAGPRWGSSQDVAIASGRDLVLVLDASRSMLTRDAFPDRLTRAQETARSLVDTLERRGGCRFGIVAFAGQPITVCPLTYDLDFVRSRLAELNFDDLQQTRPAEAVSGTRIGSAIVHALELLKSNHGGELLLLSDGDDPARDGEWARGADVAAAVHVPVHVVGIGDPEKESVVPGVDAKSKLNEGVLKEIAGRTSGTYEPARTQRLDTSSLVRNLWKTPVDETASTVSRRPAQPAPFLLAGIACMILGLTYLPVRRTLLATTGLLAIAAHPTHRFVHRGNEELAANRAEQALIWYDKAVERTPDPGQVSFNQGVALATLGRYREAELHFRRSLSDVEGDRRIRALYNIGTCLIRRGVGRERQALQDAITALEQSLSLASGDDAMRNDIEQNLKIARDLLGQAPPESKSTASERENSQGPTQPDTKTAPSSPSDAASDASPKGLAKLSKAGVSKGKNGRETNQPPPPGKGNLPTLPDNEVVEPIAPEDLAVYLERANERITADRKNQLKSRLPTKPPSYPDW